MPLRSTLHRTASFLALAAGALVLMADSTDCPDGYAPATWNASFQSTCPLGFAPATGAVHFTSAKTSDSNDAPLRDALTSSLRDAGFGIESVVESTANDGKLCTASGFTMSLADSTHAIAGSWTCDPVTFDRDAQTVWCRPSSSKPLVMRLGAQAVDASGIDPDAASRDGAAADASSSADADAASDPGSPVPPPDDAGSGATPAPVVTSCSVTFTRVGP